MSWWRSSVLSSTAVSTRISPFADAGVDKVREAPLKLSEFRRAVVDEFGAGFGAVIAHDLVIAELDGRTADEALASGVPTAQVWAALCRARGVPVARIHGAGRPEPRD